MISHRHRCIFVHQRKSAGTTVKALFPDATGADRGRFNDGVLDPEWHAGNPLVRDYLTFTVVRNPWDRFVSGWQYCASTRDRPIADVLANLPRPRLAANILAPGASLGSRVHYARELARRRGAAAKHALRGLGPARWGRRVIDEGHDYRHLTRQQVESVFYADGSPAVDRVIFFERLEEGLEALAREVGLPLERIPHHKGRRPQDDYRRHFDEAARGAFARAYARDIAAWGYDFETGLPAALR